jgi:choline dehydrogenase-like flavoprotein
MSSVPPTPHHFLYYLSHSYSREESQLAHTLSYRGQLALGGLLLAPFYIVPGMNTTSTTLPFFISNTFAGLFMLWLCHLLGAGDVRRFRGMVRAIIAGLVAGYLTPVIFLFLPVYSPVRLAMLISAVALFALTLSLFWYARQAEKNVGTPHASVWQPKYPTAQHIGVERAVQVFLRVFGVGSLIFALVETVTAYLVASTFPEALPFFHQPFFVIGSNIKLILLGAVAIEMARDVRGNFGLLSILITGNIASFVAIVGLFIFRLINPDDLLIVGGLTISIGQMMLLSLLLDGCVVIALLYLWHRLHLALLPTLPASAMPRGVPAPTRLRFLSPRAFRALEALAETLIAGEGAERIEPYRVAWNVDRYLSSFNSKRLSIACLAVMTIDFIPLLSGMPPLSYMNAQARRQFIERYFRDDILKPPASYLPIEWIVREVNRLLLRGQRLTATERANEMERALRFDDLMEAIIRINTQLCYMGYYGDPAVWPKEAVERPVDPTVLPTTGIGYVPFSQRTTIPLEQRRRPNRYRELVVQTPDQQTHQHESREADIVIIGSGAAGGILAERLLALDPDCTVTLLEKGPYVPSSTFDEDEVGMISKLYSDGALQLAQSLRFSILQGSCVGGSTVVNNAVCFTTPPEILARWNDLAAGIDAEAFFDAQEAVMHRLRIGPVRDTARTPLDDLLNHGASAHINAGVRAYFNQMRPDQRYDYEVVQANIEDCLGCGYCNIGCAYDRKLSILTEVLPKAQQDHGPERLKIIAEAEVTRLHHHNGKVREIEVSVGKAGKTIRIINPRKVIVSGGVIASSWLLMQSGIRVDGHVGRGVSFNMGTPLHGWFDRSDGAASSRATNSYDGLQISHYLRLRDNLNFVFETWYNPPVAQALAMPGWLETHFSNMQRYDEMVALGILVGTEATGVIKRAALYRGPEVSFKPGREDMIKLREAIGIARDVLFSAGAKEVYISSRRHSHYVNPTHVQKATFNRDTHQARSASMPLADDLAWVVADERDIMLASGHPQGGNALGKVVMPDFKVRGFLNLYVCDASVFPTSITVNPQLTIMSLAHYAAHLIANR